MRTTSKITETVSKLMFERRISNKLGDKFQGLGGNFQMCNLTVPLIKAKHLNGQELSRTHRRTGPPLKTQHRM